MKQMKKLLALLLALMMCFALAACGSSSDSTTTEDTSDTTEETSDADTTEESSDADTAEETDEVEAEAEAETEDTTSTETVSADDIDDNMTSEDGTYEIAFVTDVGSLKDKSFNEGTWNGVKLYAYENGLSYKYYQPANESEATDDDRYDAMAAACDAGAKVVVCAGYLQETALTQAAIAYPDVQFVFIDGYTLYDGDTALTNVAGINFQEEQCGYFAGYAAVMEGYTELGFSGGGGGTNPACCRYGYGYVQGANDAAAALGITVNINYSWLYGSSYSASPDLQTMISGWYSNGTEVVFACGGSMFSSIATAAAENDGAVIGVDVDQSSESDTVITSAMKGLAEATEYAVGKYYDGTWDEIGGTTTTLGAADGAVGLPTDTWSMTNFTVEDYEALLASVVSGELVVDNDYENNFDQEYSNVVINMIE
ncbi:MAG: BMP family ABC transporter substrate-binding protein [Clostridiales bacterium]|nr:BMP family ABC transporter substrate-binding protein [Clostridiales bacterium]